MNTPRKAPSSNKWSVNNQVSDLILSVLNAVEKKPENKWKNKFEILKKFLNDYSIDGNSGLLEDISKTSNISFDMIKDDGFDIWQIIWDDNNTSSSTLHIILNSPSLWTIWKDIEKIVISELTKKAKSKVPSWLQSKFDQEMNGANTLNDLKKQIRNFLQFGGIDDNTKNEIKKVKITNKDMVDWLVKDWKLQASDIVWDYKNWNDSYKKSFDKIITQEYIDWLKDSANFVEKNLNMIKDTFTNFVPNMWRIFDKYPYDIEKIKKEEPEIAAQLEELQEKWDHENFNKACLYAYIWTIKDKKIWNVLDKLFQNKFDFSKLDKKEQSDLLDEVVDSRLQELKKGWIADLLEVDQSNFDWFVKDIFDMDKNEVTIPCTWWDIKLWISKKFRWWENKNFSDINNFAESKLPIDFDIKISGDNKDLIDNSALKYIFADEISDDGKSINLDGNNIGKLLLMYTLWEASFDKKNMSPEKVKKLEKLIDVMNEKKKLNEIDEKNRGNEEDWEDWKDWEGETWNKAQEIKEKPEEEFFNAWKKIKWHEFPQDQENFWFVNWTRLWIKLWETELPPVNVWWDLWVQMEIIDIWEKDFKVKLTWWELASEKYEWKVISYPKTKDSIDMISNAFNGEIYKLPNPVKWEETLWTMKWAWLSNLQWLDFFDEIKYEKWKFISNIQKDDKNNWKEITHFWTDEKTYDDKGKEETKPVFYKITHNNNWTITLEYENYKREMDYNNFIIFVSTKQLKPATKDHVEENIKNYDNEAKASLGGRKRQLFGVTNLTEWLLWIGKKFNESFKKYNDERTEAFNEFLVSDVRIFQKLTSITSFIPWVANALQWAELEYYNERDGKVWKKIQKWITIFEADPDFGESFSKKWYLPAYLWSSSLEDMVVSGKQPKDRYIAAAALIALMSKWKSPYRSIQWLRMQWAWVKLLLGESHQKRFLEHQKELVREIENNKWLYWSGYDSQMTNDLVRAEMTYLVNNIWWRATWQRFGQIPKDDDPKKMRSDKFAWELDKNYNEWISQGKIEETYNWLKHVTNFTFAYNEYKRFSASGRSPQALAYLKKMGTLVKTPQQKSILKMSILAWMLNGFFLNFADKDTKWRLQMQSRSLAFAPWLRVTEYDQKEKAAYMLDYITKGSFSRYMKYNPNDFGTNAKSIWYKTFLGWDWKKDDLPYFEKWWNQWNWDTVCAFLKALPKTEIKDNDAIMLGLKALPIESQVEATDKDIDTNSKAVTDSPLSQTKWLIQQKMLKYDNGIFSWDIDQIQASEDFWNEVSKEISKWNVSSEELKSVLNIFLNRFDKTFDENWKSDLVRRLSTIQWYKKKMVDGKVQQEWGKISQKDINNVMWYSIVWEIAESERSSPPAQLKSALESFYSLFQDNIDKFDENMISSVFGSRYVEDFKNPYYLAPRDEYEDVVKNYAWLYMTEEEREEDESHRESGMSKEEKETRRKKKAYYNNEDIFLNKKLKKLETSISRKWLQWHPLGRSIKDISRTKKIAGNS